MRNGGPLPLAAASEPATAPEPVAGLAGDEIGAKAALDGETGHGQRTLGRPRWVVLAGIAVVALFAVAYFPIKSRMGKSNQPKINSLAVLPLKNLSGDPAQEYLADGMTETLIGRLSTIHDLRVISRTSVMRFKASQLSVPEIAKALGCRRDRRRISDPGRRPYSRPRPIDSSGYGRTLVGGKLRSRVARHSVS